MEQRTGKITPATFEFAVSRYFTPIAKRTNLPIVRLKDNLYEIQSQYFSLRVEHTHGHIGHGIHAIIFPTKEGTASVEYPPRSISIGIIAKYNGVDMTTSMVRVIEDFMSQAEFIAQIAEKFCVPYLLGQENDFEKIENFKRFPKLQFSKSLNPLP